MTDPETEDSLAELAARYANAGVEATDDGLASRQLQFATVTALLAVERSLGELTASVDELVRYHRFQRR